MDLIIFAYLLIINIMAFFATTTDKFRAIKGKRFDRIPESTLVILSILGGSVTMLITMIIIKHKTKKPKFMLGIPIIIAIQLGLIFLSVKSGGLNV